MIEEKKEIVNLALSMGETMLCSGGEIYRVEDMMRRICISRGIKEIDVFATPTILMISYNDFDKSSLFKRIVYRNTSLDKVSLINNLSREFTSTNMSIIDAKKIMNNIKYGNNDYKIKKFIFAGVVASFYSLLKNGNIRDFAIAFIAGMMSQIIYDYSNKIAQSPFISNILAGFCIGIIGYVSNVYMNIAIDPVIIGAIMPFVPGVALTNAVRDFIYGDLLSGSSRFFEAIMIATSIAVGVSFGISIINNIL